MQRAELTGLNKHLGRLEKNLARIQSFQEKGCPVDSSLNDLYSELTDIGDYIKKKAQAEMHGQADQELGDIIARHKSLLTQFETIANDVKPQSEGMVLASANTLPDFFRRITSRNRSLWKSYEYITALFGIGIIVFTVAILTYFFAFGRIPFVQFRAGALSGINTLAFVLGVIIGLCVHEFAHGIVLANNGIKIKRVGAVAGSIVGGFVEADETTFFEADPRVHLRFNAASIGTNAILALILGIMGLLTSSEPLIFLALGDLFFGFINSFPISPLDGGWVYEDLVKLYVANKKVKRIFLAARFVLFVLWIVLFTYSVLFHFS